MNKPAQIVLLFIATFFTIVYLSITYASPQKVVVNAAENGVQSTSETHIIKNQQLSVSVEDVAPKKPAPEPSGGNVALLGSSVFILGAIGLVVGYILIRRRKTLGRWLKGELDDKQENY